MTKHKIFAFSIIFTLLGCSVDNKPPKVSSDLTTLKKLIEIDTGISTLKWETFNTPEYTGGVPGPTDFITLIAEFESNDPHWFTRLPVPKQKFYIAPNASRTWLSSPFRKLMSKNQNTAINLATNGCRMYRTRMTKSRRIADAVVCNSDTKILLYYNVVSPQNADGSPSSRIEKGHIATVVAGRDFFEEHYLAILAQGVPNVTFRHKADREQKS